MLIATYSIFFEDIEHSSLSSIFIIGQEQNFLANRIAIFLCSFQEEISSAKNQHSTNELIQQKSEISYFVPPTTQVFQEPSISSKTGLITDDEETDEEFVSMSDKIIEKPVEEKSSKPIVQVNKEIVLSLKNFSSMILSDDSKAFLDAEMD